MMSGAQATFFDVTSSRLALLQDQVHPSGHSVSDSHAELIRRITDRQGAVRLSAVPKPERLEADADLQAALDLAWLRLAEKPELTSDCETLRCVDLFAGCGGLTLGIEEAARALGSGIEVVLANDTDAHALATYAANWPKARTHCGPVEQLFDGTVGARLTLNERRLRRELGRVHLVIGGPPCQGHSDLNNHTRRVDPKNELYFRMARVCEVLEPDHLIIENVPGVLHDQSRVAQRTWERLQELGYRLSTGVVDAAEIGVAQRRRRCVTLASRKVHPDLSEAIGLFEVPPRPLSWALTDLLDHPNGTSVYDSAPKAKPESVRRINYLFDHDIHDLPDTERPECHRLKSHSYKSMYGRMHWDRPAQTITTGFGVMGRGRFVHPTQRRTITPHEAARIQFFPDFFDFGLLGRTRLQLQIGNAVPPKLGLVLGVHLLA